jgi:transcriptional regulator with XRE-family HTH domain
MDDIYALSDQNIEGKIGERIKATRLKQNITQAALASDAGISLSSLKKIEGGHIGSFDSLIRTMRVLGLLEHLQRLAEPAELSPTEYYEFVNSAAKHIRKRARNHKAAIKKDTEW